MWRISSIHIIVEQGDSEQSLPCLYFIGKLRNRIYNLTLKLVEDSGDVVHLKWYEWRTAGMSNRRLSWDDMSVRLKEYNPYGYIPGLTGDDNCLLVAVDDASYRFLDYIEAIRPVEFNNGLYKNLRSLRGLFGFVFIDKMKSIVDVNQPRGVKRAFPLFQATCFAPAGWQDDGYYMWNKQGTTLYRVEFIDVREARAFAGKHAATGYGNPMMKGIGVIRSFSGILE